MRRRRKATGFTLVEVLLVLAILGVLMGMVVPRLMGRQKQANVDATRLSIKGVEQALKLYALDHAGEYPRSASGLNALLQPPQANSMAWRGPYLDTQPVDAWGNPFHFVSPGQLNPGGVDIVSPGADGTLHTDDDITNQPARS